MHKKVKWNACALALAILVTSQPVHAEAVKTSQTEGDITYAGIEENVEVEADEFVELLTTDDVQEEKELEIENENQVIMTSPDDGTYHGLAEAEIETGYYQISVAAKDSLCIDISAASDNNGANAQIYEANKSFAQCFYIEEKENGWYVIQNMSSKKNLGTSELSAIPGANIAQWTAENEASQEFKFYLTANGSYVLRSNAGEDLVLDVYGGMLQNGGNLQTYTYNGTKAQHFSLKTWEIPGKEAEVEEGVYRIYPTYAPNLSLDVYGGGMVNGTNVQVYDKNGMAAQEWKIVKKGEWYQLINENSSLVLDVSGGSRSPFANVQQWANNGSDAQLYRFYEVNENEYYIMSKLGTVVDISGGILQGGTNVQMYTANATKAQMWNFEKLVVTSKMERTVLNGYYCLETGNAEGYILTSGSDNIGFSLNEKANDSESQVFKVERQSDGWYLLTNIANGKYLKTENGLLQSDECDSDGNKFKFYDAGNGQYYLRSALNCFMEANIEENSVSAGEINALPNQAWKIVTQLPESSEIAVEEGCYNIHSALDNSYVLDIACGSTNSGGNVQIYVQNYSWAQEFYIQSAEDGWYTIKNTNSNLYLDVSGASSLDGANLQQWEENNSSAQKFKFYDVGGTVVIKSQLGTVVDVYGGTKALGQNVHMYSYNGTNAQRWVLKKNDISQKLAYIRMYEGTRYFYGGSTPAGWDCSGFTQWALNYLGVSIPRSSSQQAVAGTAVPHTNMALWKPGDVLIYSGNGRVRHVALYLGNGMLMHALNPRVGTVIQAVDYYERIDSVNNLCGVRRYL